MKKFSFALSSSLLVAVVILNSCKKDVARKQPNAYAGEDQRIVLPANSAILKGNAADTDGKIVNYEWRRVAGSASFTIVDAAVPVTTVKNLIEGVYEFELKVTDNDGLIATDKVVVTVESSTNNACVGCWDF